MSQTSKNIKSTTNESNKQGFVFQKINYQLLILSLIVTAVGFLLMMGTEDIYSFTKITLAPIVVVAGFALGFVAILYKPKNKIN
ncbi:DUF3098 domain-containing protein [Sphingobacterium lactis]|uniref:DUF3098 domain-containing protein n=1 Tax=Sphingobacterium lactis TaxID=797291 RepID=UPI003DA2D025